MAINSSVSRSTNQRMLAHLRTLRLNLDQARSALLHYKDDRVDRDKLEPAARRVDQLMDMFASGTDDPAQSRAYLADIQSGVERLANPKAAAALQAAGVEITALLAVMTAIEQASPTAVEKSDAARPAQLTT
jgi:hypothetical protein